MVIYAQNAIYVQNTSSFCLAYSYGRRSIFSKLGSFTNFVTIRQAMRNLFFSCFMVEKVILIWPNGWVTLFGRPKDPTCLASSTSGSSVPYKSNKPKARQANSDQIFTRQFCNPLFANYLHSTSLSTLARFFMDMIDWIRVRWWGQWFTVVFGKR